MLKIYGPRQSRAYRTLWMAGELGLPYEHETLERAESRTDYARVNPNRKVPAIQDGDVALFESMAINVYLATKYGRDTGLWPASIEDQGRALQWSFWVMTEAESAVVDLLIQRMFVPEAQRDGEKIKAAEEKLVRPLGVLDAALGDRPYLLGNEFSVADLNVASVILQLGRMSMDLSAYPHVSDWLRRCAKRPANLKAQGR